MNKDGSTFWDGRYSAAGYIFGTDANDFLASVVHRLPPGRVLCLGEGEGRNAVFLAGHGFEVTAVDASAVGLRKAGRLAGERGVEIETLVADLEDFSIETQVWDVVVLIFVHLPPDLRRRVHRAAVRGLKPGGALVLEAYTPEQLELNTGGPPQADLLMRLDDLRTELEGLDLEVAREIRREIHEGPSHDGISSVVQVLGFRPAMHEVPERAGRTSA